MSGESDSSNSLKISLAGQNTVQGATETINLKPSSFPGATAWRTINIDGTFSSPGSGFGKLGDVGGNMFYATKDTGHAKHGATEHTSDTTGLTAALHHMKKHPDAVAHVIKYHTARQHGPYAPIHKPVHPKHPARHHRAPAAGGEGGMQPIIVHPANTAAAPSRHAATAESPAMGWRASAAQARAQAAANSFVRAADAAALPRLAAAFAQSSVLPAALASQAAPRAYAPIPRNGAATTPLSAGRPNGTATRPALPAGRPVPGIVEQFIPANPEESSYATLPQPSSVPATPGMALTPSPASHATEPDAVRLAPYQSSSTPRGYTQEELEEIFSDFLDRQARLPPSGTTAFDPALSPAWPGLKMPG